MTQQSNHCYTSRPNEKKMIKDVFLIKNNVEKWEYKVMKEKKYQNKKISQSVNQMNC